MTKKTSKDVKRKSHDNSNELANVWDSILKSRNSKYVSLSGLKEHIIIYLASGKSNYVSELLSHIGGRGTRKIIETILDKSELACRFTEPKKISIFVSFDNIQKMYPQHRISDQEQEKVYAVIVCSILALLPDGYTTSSVQYTPSNSMAAWYTQLDWNFESNTFSNIYDSDVLKSMTKTKDSDYEIIEKYWNEEIQEQLKIVAKEINSESCTDEIDFEVNVQKQKRIRHSG